MIIRTKEEILQYYSEDSGWGHRGDVLDYLSFEDIKQFYTEEYVKKAETGEEQYILRTNPIEQAREYINFAWGKANDCRGLSSDRSIQHFMNWFWLCDDEFYQKLKKSYDDHYQCYGKPQLVLVCEYLGIDWKQLDDGQWRNDEGDDRQNMEQVLEACRKDKTLAEKFSDKLDAQLKLARMLTENGEVTDYKKQLAKTLYSGGDSFDGLIFILHHKAQTTKSNLEKLKKGFPEHFELWNEWYYCGNPDAFFSKYGVN